MNSVLAWLLRIGVAVVLLALGVLSLPLVAIVFDSPGQEGWIIPVQVVVMALIGAGIGMLVPALAGSGASRARAATVGALIALLGVAISLVMFYLLLDGLGGL